MQVYPMNYFLKKAEQKYGPVLQPKQRKVALEAMWDYSKQNEDVIQDIFLKPMEELKPLEELYKKEHPSEKYYTPDLTDLCKWITKKMLSYETNNKTGRANKD